MIKKTIFAILALSICLTSCDSWVENAETPSNTVTREQLNKATMIANVQSNKLSDGPLVANVRTLQGTAAAGVFLALGTTVDELTEGTIPNTLLYRQIVNDNATPRSGTQDGLWDQLQDYYARSKELIEVAEQIPTGNAQTEISKMYGQYMGHLHAGYALQLLAETFSSTPETGDGGVIINKALLSRQDLYTQANEHYEAAAKAITSSVMQGFNGIDRDAAYRQIMTYELKLSIHQGDYNRAATLIDKAINNSNGNIEVIYGNDGGDNPLYSAIGPNARNVQVSPSLEAARTSSAMLKALPLKHASVDKQNPNRYNIYAAALTRKGALVLTDIDEIHLIKAELIIRGLITGNALNEVNTVISQYDSSSQLTTAPSLNDIADLRRIFLAFRGERTADIRRGLEQGTIATTWQNRKIKWLPMPERELSAMNM